ncbi:MAG: sigma-54 dependent transcriptional regulator [Pseudomonadota bacterium]
MTPKVLIIDDDLMFCEVLSLTVGRLGHEVTYVHTLGEGLRLARSTPLDVVFLDVRLPDGNGLKILPELRETESSPEVIIVTGLGDPDGAEMAITGGAWDYVEKGSSIQEITLPLMRALQYRAEKQSKKTPILLKRDRIIGGGAKLAERLELVAQAAGSQANVLITGETGVGKGLFAQAIHENSSRADRNFVVVDCTALPETLTESLLFGYERGAFTGADKARDGLIKQADGGYLFLDEVGELPLSIQKAFLRVLQEKRFRPLGANRETESDFALIAATNRDLGAMVKDGRFREDLFFRLRAFSIEIPPLRERGEDISELAVFRLAELCRRYGMGVKGFSPEFMEALLSYPWPGHVRELFNCLDAAIAAAGREPTLFPAHLPAQIRISVARASVSRDGKSEPSAEKTPGPSRAAGFPGRYKTSRDAFEKDYLEALIDQVKGNVVQACRISGLSRTRYYQLLKKHGLAPRPH